MVCHQMGVPLTSAPSVSSNKSPRVCRRSAEIGRGYAAPISPSGYPIEIQGAKFSNFALPDSFLSGRVAWGDQREVKDSPIHIRDLYLLVARRCGRLKLLPLANLLCGVPRVFGVKALRKRKEEQLHLKTMSAQTLGEPLQAFAQLLMVGV